MKATDYLQSLINNTNPYRLTAEDKKQIQFEGIETYIMNKLQSSKFKGSKVPKPLRRTVRNAVANCIANNKPIHISIPFGGFKKWQLDSAPNLDWAEVFNIIQLREYVKPIAAAYKLGVVIDYFSDEVFIARMDNYPQADLDQYNDQFIQLIKYFNNLTNNNIQFKFSKIRNEISGQEVNARLDKAIVKVRSEWSSLSKEEQNAKLVKAERNYQINWNDVDLKEKTRLLTESALVHDAFIAGDWDEGVPWAFAEDMVPVGFRYTGTWGIHLKSSRSSSVQFWVGSGVLLEREGEYVESILSYESLKDSKAKMEKININGIAHISPQLATIAIFN